MFKKAIQQARPACVKATAGRERSWLVCRSLWRRLGAFFNIPRKGSEDLATSSAPAVDLSNLGHAPRACVVSFTNFLK